MKKDLLISAGAAAVAFAVALTAAKLTLLCHWAAAYARLKGH